MSSVLTPLDQQTTDGDHNYIFFVAASEVDAVRTIIDSNLPTEFHGWPVYFGWDEMPVQHHVNVVPLGEWLKSHLGFNPQVNITVQDWLTTPQQLLLEVTAGAVLHDPDGDLKRVRSKLEWYPNDIWLWLLACQWHRIAQEEAFVGRTAEVSDELGSRILTARIVRDLMRLCFLIERRYAPYSKWLGSAFRDLRIAPETCPASGCSAQRDGLPRQRSGPLFRLRICRTLLQSTKPHSSRRSRSSHVL